jgi:predicted phosphodiesterase
MNVLRSCTVENREFFVLSDVHLRSLEDGQSEGTSVTASALAEFLNEALDEGIYVVINGDLFDMDRAAKPLNHRQTLQGFRTLSPDHELWSLLEDPRVILLCGNHDSKVADDLKAYHAADLRWGTTRFRIEHGERFDAWIKRIRPFTSLITWMSGVTERYSLSPLTNAMRMVESATASSTGDERLLGRVLGWLSEHSRYDGILFGHTHRAMTWATPVGLVANSGQAMHWPIDALRLDLERNEIKQLSIDDKLESRWEETQVFSARTDGCASGSKWKKMAAELGIFHADSGLQ